MGSSICSDHHHLHHKFHPSLLSPKKSMQDFNIPPRKLLSRRSAGLVLDDDYMTDSPSKLLHAEAMIQKFLPYNGDSSERVDDGFDSDSDPYSSDQFRMYEFKVRKCTRSRSHDWTDCPFAHPGEKARRRDPRKFHYSGTVCPEYRRSGSCSRGDECEFAHGVFECWLHPARYRTEACKDGKNCKRKVCFFAHSPRELRVLPAGGHDDDDRDNCGSKNTHAQHCCRYCCAISPTSTLMGRSHFSPPMSPSLSPPLSPIKAAGYSGLSPVSRYSDRVTACGSGGDTMGLPPTRGLCYEDMVIAEILGSLEGMSLNEAVASLKSGNPNKGSNGLWVDVGYDNSVGNHNGGNTNIVDEQMQFSLSPSTPMNPSPTLSMNFLNNINGCVDDDKGVENGLPGPDLGWVNELLM